jgi:hypothetical protein
MAPKLKRIAVVASGWHFPAHFYESMVKQIRPEGWEVDYFCISHRDPKFAIEEHSKDVFGNDLRGSLDKVLYREVATQQLIENLGWNYKLCPNTVGDWGNSNQWLEEHDYKQYDLYLFTHDDNLIIHDRLFADTIADDNFKQWDILTNSPGAPAGSIRGSFEFFKKKVLKLMGGKFDLSTITLNREGETENSTDLLTLNDWNNIVYPLNQLIEKHKLKIGYLSPCYRVSAYCIEGERGFISRTHGQNTKYEDAGLQYLKNNGVI